MHLSEAQLFCPGLKLLGSALVEVGDVCLAAALRKGLGEGGDGRVILLRRVSVNGNGSLHGHR